MKKFPNALVIMLMVIILAWIATFLIPSGQYQRSVDPLTNQEKVIGGTFQTLPAESVSFFRLLLAIPEGIVQRADLIVLILLVGGCFYVIEQTGALKQGIVLLTKVLKGKEEIALISVSILFAAGGALTGLQEEIIAMIPVLLFFTAGLGYNKFVAIFMSVGSAIIGGAFSPINPFAVVIAQKEAGLEFLSGTGYRLIVFGIAFVAWMVFMIRYANRNKIEKIVHDVNEQSLTKRSGIILILLGLAFVILVYGMLKLNWGFNEISALFFALGIAAGLIGKLGINGTSEAYIAGFKEMVFAAMIAGLASSISFMLKEGQVIDTIVYAMFIPMQYLPKSLAGIAMLVSHAVIHLPFPSYSGQAILTMPILIPLSDLLGISRQVCVLAFQYGAVLMDLIIPTNGALMAILAIAGISYNHWIKFIFKPAIIIFFIAAAAIITATFISYV
jgi:uncharacterized ion transporter superfamily protein YfcC